jgi:hypothetical protein
LDVADPDVLVPDAEVLVGIGLLGSAAHSGTANTAANIIPAMNVPARPYPEGNGRNITLLS